MSQDNSSDEVFHDAIEELPTTIRKMTKKNPTSSKKNVKTPKKNQITLKKLVKYKKYLQALANTENQEDLITLIDEMKTDSFQVLCTCMDDFLHDMGIMHNYFNEDEASRLKHIITPWSKKLKQFTNPKTSLVNKKKLLKTKHKGGSVKLASIVQSLIPLALDAAAMAL